MANNALTPIKLTVAGTLHNLMNCVIMVLLRTTSLRATVFGVPLEAHVMNPFYHCL